MDEQAALIQQQDKTLVDAMATLDRQVTLITRQDNLLTNAAQAASILPVPPKTTYYDVSDEKMSEINKLFTPLAPVDITSTEFAGFGFSPAPVQDAQNPSDQVEDFANLLDPDQPLF